MLVSFHFSETFCYSHSQLQKIQEKQADATYFVKRLDSTMMCWAKELL